MKASRFSEEQIIGMIKEQEAGMPTADVCRKHGMSSATFYQYKAKFGGINVSEARRLKVIEDELTPESAMSQSLIIRFSIAQGEEQFLRSRLKSFQSPLRHWQEKRDGAAMIRMKLTS